MALDVTELSTKEKSNQGVEVQIQHPTTGENLATIKVLGTESDKFRTIQKKYFEKTRNKKMSAVQVEQFRYESVAECVVSWDGIVENGKPIGLSKESAISVFRRCPWMLEQIEDAMGDTDLFLSGKRPSQAQSSGE